MAARRVSLLVLYCFLFGPLRLISTPLLRASFSRLWPYAGLLLNRRPGRVPVPRRRRQQRACLADGLLSHLHQGRGLQERGRARSRLDPWAVRRRRNRSSEAAERRACCYGQRRGQWRSRWRWCRDRLGRRRRLLRVCGGGGVRGRVGCVGACPRQPKSLIAYSGPEWRNNNEVNCI